jgi:DNA-binding MarR family transcriptional regulator
MADIKTTQARPGASPLYLRDEELKQGVDLLFAAFTDVFAEGDAVLKEAGLGRAHRRALYFIARTPGISVAGLLAVLKITKQSLSRVLNDLLAAGYVARRTAPDDRRMRQLRLTEKGAELEAALWAAQRPRMVAAFREAGPEAVAGFRQVLSALSGRGLRRTNS